MCLCNNYCSEIRKLLVVEICDSLHILNIETSSIQQDCCMLLVAGAGTLDPGVPGSLQLMTASWLTWVETSRPTVSALETFLVINVRSQCVRRRDGTCICHLQNLLSGCLRGIMKLAVEENKDIVD